MATLFASYVHTFNAETRTLLLILLILAIALIVTGAIIALVTFLSARKQRAAMPE